MAEYLAFPLKMDMARSYIRGSDRLDIFFCRRTNSLRTSRPSTTITCAMYIDRSCSSDVGHSMDKAREVAARMSTCMEKQAGNPYVKFLATTIIRGRLDTLTYPISTHCSRVCSIVDGTILCLHQSSQAREFPPVSSPPSTVQVNSIVVC